MMSELLRDVTQREIIRCAPSPAHPPFAVEAVEATGHVILEVDGLHYWFGSSEAARLGRALLRAVSVVDGKPIGSSCDPDDDPELW